MVKSKKYYAERIILGLQNRYPNIDFKIDEREVFLAIDDVVNAYAEKNYFDQWKFTGEGVDEQFITTFEVNVIDQANELPSYFEFPANYAALPRNRGIEEIWPHKYQLDGNDHSVVVISRTDWRRYKNMHVGTFQGRLAGYPESTRFYFTEPNVKKKYGELFGCRLVIKDSSQITADAPYPIPGNYEGLVIESCIQYFNAKRGSDTDTVRDKNDSGPITPRRFIRNVADQEA